MAGPQPQEMRHPAGRANGDEDLRIIARMVDGRRRLGRHPQQLLDSARIFMLLGALVFTWWRHVAAGSCDADNEHFAFFVLWLLGTALAMLAIVAAQFPSLALAADKLASALRNYLLGGL